MVGGGKTFELLDFLKFAYPSVLNMDPYQTAINLVDRLGGKSFMSYASIYSRMTAIVGGYADEAFLKGEFDIYADEWKNNSIRDAVRLLRAHFGGRGTWYPFPSKPVYVFGFWFKPSIKGIWYVDGQAHAVLINARKGQRLVDEHVRYLARGIYELHCVDDPNDPIPLIVDLSEHSKGDGRGLHVHAIPVDRAITLDEFDAAIRVFLKALELAGVAVPSKVDVANIVDFFKRK